MYRVRVAASLCVLALGAGICPGQQTSGRIHGSVVDPTGAAVPDAAVTAERVETGAVRRVVSGPEGLYAIPALPLGSYRLAVTADGFRPAAGERIGLAIGGDARADFVLEVGAATDEVTVSGVLSALDTSSAAISSVIPNRFIVSLPLNGRNFLELSLLVPGAVPAATGSPGSERGRFALQTNGARETANSFLYDGVYAVDPILNSFAFAPPVDAVREFRIQTSNSEAGLGRNSGGQISVAIKQGTNELHGTMYEFLRNDHFDARNFFSRPNDPVPTLRRNQFGASAGGPLVRNSAFVFANFEGLREARSVTRTTNVPTMAERAGDFSGPGSRPPLNFLTRQPFSNASLPFMNPIGQAVAGLYPEPNREVAGQNYVAAPVGDDRTAKFDVRVDQRLGDRGQLSGRYSFSDSSRLEPYAAQQFSSLPGYGNNLDQRGQNVMVAETHTLASRWINEARFGFNRIGNRTIHQNSGTSLNSEVGLPDFATRDLDLGLSFIQVTGLSSLGGEYNNPQVSTVTTWQVSDTLSYSRGRHLVQLGFEQRGIRQDGFRKRPLAREPLLHGSGVHAECVCRPSAWAAELHAGRAQRDNPGGTDGRDERLRNRHLAPFQDRDPVAWPALRVQTCRRTMPRTRRQSTTPTASRSSSWARGACRGADSAPTATTWRRGSASPFVPSAPSGRLSAPAGACSTTFPTWLPDRASTSTRRSSARSCTSRRGPHLSPSPGRGPRGRTLLFRRA